MIESEERVSHWSLLGELSTIPILAATVGDSCPPAHRPWPDSLLPGLYVPRKLGTLCDGCSSLAILGLGAAGQYQCLCHILPPSSRVPGAWASWFVSSAGVEEVPFLLEGLSGL